MELPVGTTAAVSGQSDDMKESFRSLQFTMLLAVFLVYLVMASQFESLLHPFVILLTIPLALVGSVWAMFLTGTTVNVVAYIGLIMLAGIVVNQSIVLIDAVNQARERGLAKHDAIIEAARLRLRPIVITKLTTILGLLPMAIGLGEGAEIRKPMAITVIGGVAVASFFTLLVIPVVYSLLDRKKFQPTGAGVLPRVATESRRRLSHDPHAIRVAQARHDADDLHRDLADRPDRDSTLLPLELFPDIRFPGIQVTIPYAGSTPEEVEQLITRPAEEAIATLSGIKEIRSTSSETGAELVVFFQWDRDPAAVGFEVRTKLESIRHEFPPSANRILTQMFAAGDDRVLAVRISSQEDLTRQYDTLDRYLKKPLERLDGVARVSLEGVEPLELQDPRRPRAPCRPWRRHRAAARFPRGRELLGQRGRGHRGRAALPGAPDRRIPDAR